jgi:hypothetical protein
MKITIQVQPGNNLHQLEIEASSTVEDIKCLIEVTAGCAIM